MPVVTDFPCRWDYIEQPPACCPDWADASEEAKDRALALAAWFLWAATGRRFGLCETTVLPCRQSCPCTGDSCHAWRTGPPWQPVRFDGKWYNAPCGCSACRCCAPAEVWLPGRVDEILMVVVDGLVVDPDAYRVDNDQFLVRDDGGSWPLCGNLGARQRPNGPSPSESPGEPPADGWAVTYLRGEAVPYPGQVATADLACSLLNRCDHGPGDVCDCNQLPPGLSRIQREGITMEITPDTVMAMAGQSTGIAAVDSWVKQMNPYGLAQPTKVLSPDVGGERTVTWP